MNLASCWQNILIIIIAMVDVQLFGKNEEFETKFNVVWRHYIKVILVTFALLIWCSDVRGDHSWRAVVFFGNLTSAYDFSRNINLCMTDDVIRVKYRYAAGYIKLFSINQKPEFQYDNTKYEMQQSIGLTTYGVETRVLTTKRGWCST